MIFPLFPFFQSFSTEREQINLESKDLAMIIGPAAVGLVVVFLIGIAAFCSVARKKRSLHGTYSPQKQEFNAPRLELANMMKIPTVERLIWETSRVQIYFLKETNEKKTILVLAWQKCFEVKQK